MNVRHCCSSVVIPDSLNTDTDLGFWWQKLKKKNTAETIFFLFVIKNGKLGCAYLEASRRSLHSALKREHPALQNMKLINFFSIFALLDPDPQHWFVDISFCAARSWISGHHHVKLPKRLFVKRSERRLGKTLHKASHRCTSLLKCYFTFKSMTPCRKFSLPTFVHHV